MRTKVVAVSVTVAVLLSPPLMSGTAPRKAARPILHVWGELSTTEYGKLVARTFGKYQTVSIAAGDVDFVAPMPVEQPRLHDPGFCSGPSRGHVWVMHVVMVDGGVQDPVVVTSTHGKLNAGGTVQGSHLAGPNLSRLRSFRRQCSRGDRSRPSWDCSPT
jgi:hypothetical protein